MPQPYEYPTALETLSADHWWPKFVMGPLLLFVAYGTLNSAYPWSSVVSLGFFLAACALMSLTRIKPEPEALKYRRLFRWRPLSYSDIRNCDTFSVFGFIRARPMIFPLGEFGLSFLAAENMTGGGTRVPFT